MPDYGGRGHLSDDIMVLCDTLIAFTLINLLAIMRNQRATVSHKYVVFTLWNQFSFGIDGWAKNHDYRDGRRTAPENQPSREVGSVGSGLSSDHA